VSWEKGAPRSPFGIPSFQRQRWLVRIQSFVYTQARQQTDILRKSRRLPLRAAVLSEVNTPIVIEDVTLDEFPGLRGASRHGPES